MNQMIRWLLTAFFIELILISDVSKEPSPILDPQTLTSDILNRRGKNLCHFVQKMGKEKKRKLIGIVKLYALTSKRKNSQ